MFRRALRALGGSRRSGDRSVLGGRQILIPPKPEDARSLAMTGGPRRETAADRRRRNLTFLAGFIVATFILGLIPALRSVLYLNLVADILLVVYLGLVFYMASGDRQLRSERPPVGAPVYEPDMPPAEAASSGW